MYSEMSDEDWKSFHFDWMKYQREAIERHRKMDELMEAERMSSKNPEPFQVGGIYEGDLDEFIRQIEDMAHTSTYPNGYFTIKPDAPDGLGKTISNTINDLAMKAAPKVSPTWLEQAKKVTEESRQLEYDHPVINFIRTGINWSMWLQGRKGFPIVINPIDVAWMMNGMKFAREINVHKDDNPIDTMGYLACHDRIDRYMKKIGYPEGAEAFESMTIGELADLMQRLTLEEIRD